MKIYLSIILLGCSLLSAKASGSANEQILKQFVTAINSHDANRMGGLLSDDAVFIDAHGKKMQGREQVLSGWRGYFGWFPDYKIQVDKMINDKDTIALFGFAGGTFQHMDTTPHARWKEPASWKAVISGGKISLWQIYVDTRIPFEIIQRYSPATDDESKVLGFGGVFFKSHKPKDLCEWYDKHLGTNLGKTRYQVFQWRDRTNKEHIGSTTFGVFRDSSNYFDPSKSPFMLNFRVKNLDSFLARLKTEGVQVIDKTDKTDYGNFGWIIDCDGNKIELWEPKNEKLLDE